MDNEDKDMAKKIDGPRIATANRLHDGLVVYLAADGEWTRGLDKARIAHNAEEASALEDAAALAARANIIVDPYLIEVGQNGGGLVPVAHR